MAKNSGASTIRKRDLVCRVADLTGNKQAVAKEIIQTFLDEIVEELSRGNRLEFRDFGVFEPRKRAGRMGQNPKTLEKVIIPAMRSVKFKAGRFMKERVQ